MTNDEIKEDGVPEALIYSQFGSILLLIELPQAFILIPLLKVIWSQNVGVFFFGYAITLILIEIIITIGILVKLKELGYEKALPGLALVKPVLPKMGTHPFLTGIAMGVLALIVISLAILGIHQLTYVNICPPSNLTQACISFRDIMRGFK